MANYIVKPCVLHLFYEYDGETEAQRNKNWHFEEGYLDYEKEFLLAMNDFGFSSTKVLKVFTDSSEDFIVDVLMRENMSVYDFELLHGVSIIDAIYTRSLEFDLETETPECIIQLLRDFYDPKITEYEKTFSINHLKYLSLVKFDGAFEPVLTQFISLNELFSRIFDKVEMYFWKQYEEMTNIKSEINTIQTHEIEPIEAFNGFKKEYNILQKIEHLVTGAPKGFVAKMEQRGEKIAQLQIIFSSKEELKEINLTHMVEDGLIKSNNELDTYITKTINSIYEDGMFNDYIKQITTYFGREMGKCFIGVEKNQQIN